jgi:hypothetical protein
MKTSLKTILISALTTISAFTAVTYLSCNRDKCKTIVCANGGVCNGGGCICASGYEGSNCEALSTKKFLGNWTVLEKGSITQQSQYPISIQQGADVSHVVIKNFYNYFRTDITGNVIGDTLYIPNQEFQGKVVFGIGYIFTSNTYVQFGTISMNYEIIDTATQSVTDFGWYSGTDGSNPSIWNK